MVKAEEFVKVWQGAETIEDVAKKFDAEPNVVGSRASKYRKLGIELKYFPRTPRLDVEALKKLAKSIK